MSDHHGLLKQDRREKFARLKALLSERRTAEANALLGEYEACGQKWKGSYECGSPGCPNCRRRNANRERLRTERAFTGANNEDLALLTLVHGTTLDVSALGPLRRNFYDVTRKRFGALRSPASSWNGACTNGWWEVDALSAEQVPFLFSDRHRLLHELGAQFREGEPTWIITSHSIVYLNGMDLQEVRHGLSAFWPLAHQLDLRPFQHANPVEHNLREIAGYANKFSCIVELKSEEVRGGKVFEPWPISWEADLFSWLNSSQRSAREFTRFHIGQCTDLPVAVAYPKLQPMPSTWLHSLDYTYK
jgi:hypothetical protein